MKQSELIKLISKSKYISEKRKKSFTKMITDAVPYNKNEVRNALEALDTFETIHFAHKLSKINNVIGFDELISNLKNQDLNPTDQIKEIPFFSKAKKITAIILNEKVLVGIIEVWKSTWHEENFS